MKILKKELALEGMTVKELSDATGILEQTIYNMIRGASKPNPGTTKKLLDAGFSETAALNPAKEVEV